MVNGSGSSKYPAMDSLIVLQNEVIAERDSALQSGNESALIEVYEKINSHPKLEWSHKLDCYASLKKIAERLSQILTRRIKTNEHPPFEHLIFTARCVLKFWGDEQPAMVINSLYQSLHAVDPNDLQQLKELNEVYKLSGSAFCGSHLKKDYKKIGRQIHDDISVAKMKERSW